MNAAVEQLLAAIQAGDLVNLGHVLSPEEDDGRPAPGITDEDIQKALNGAAILGSVGACRLLWGKLSGRGALMYFAATIEQGFGSALHSAARFGHLDIVRFFVEECNFNINQKNCRDQTPLCCVEGHLQVARYLLEHGANVNPEGTPYSPLQLAIRDNRTEMARLFLVEYHADPNLNQQPVAGRQYIGSNTENAILHGNVEILILLLQCGAFMPEDGVMAVTRLPGTALNHLLRRTDTNVTHETKLAICRHLVQHANRQENHDRATTVAFLRASVELAIRRETSITVLDPFTTNTTSFVVDDSHNSEDSCQILLEAGMDPSPRWVWDCAIQHRDELICRMLVQYGADPFAEQVHVAGQVHVVHVADEQYAATPFLAAARLSDSTSIFEFFLEVWDEQFASNGGKNHSGNYPIHVVCCDVGVSLQAVQVLVNRHANALAVVDHEHSLYPFQLAAKCNASLDIIFCLLHHCPDAWSSSSAGNTSTATALPAADETTNTSSTSTGETLSNNNDSGPARKKAKKAAH